jgi:hypothetical protein
MTNEIITVLESTEKHFQKIIAIGNLLKDETIGDSLTIIQEVLNYIKYGQHKISEPVEEYVKREG